MSKWAHEEYLGFKILIIMDATMVIGLDWIGLRWNEMEWNGML